MTGAPRRRGRKRRLATRHPGGQVKRRSAAEKARDTMAVAHDARRRVFGLSTAAAARQEAVDMLGRLAISGEITPVQLTAGRAYEAMRRDYDRAMLARRTLSASDYEGVGGSGAASQDDRAYAAWVKRCIDRYDMVRAALTGCADPMAQIVLDGVALEGREMWDFVGTLRIALNAAGRVLAT